ncbi:MAG: hypothetical protein HYZ00_06325, partial [Candidatus Hydrogenedentes bacterium]|nr:hypothetical protein [Candidatus Hydrogenedentota bacterium]
MARQLSDIRAWFILLAININFVTAAQPIVNLELSLRPSLGLPNPTYYTFTVRIDHVITRVRSVDPAESSYSMLGLVIKKDGVNTTTPGPAEFPCFISVHKQKGFATLVCDGYRFEYNFRRDEALHPLPMATLHNIMLASSDVPGTYSPQHIIDNMILYTSRARQDFAHFNTGTPGMS